MGVIFLNYLKSTLAQVTALVLIVASSGCSGAHFSNSIPSLPQQVCPLSSGIHAMNCPPPGGSDPDVVNVSSMWNSSTNHGTAQTNDANGALMSNVDSTLYTNSTQFNLQSSTINASNVSTITQAQLQYGINYLPNGTLFIDPNTQVSTANVTGQDGTSYRIIGTPTSTGFTVEVDASNGMRWVRNIDAPPSATTASYHKMNGCSIAGRAANYFGGVSGVALGVAVGAALVGAEPVSAIMGAVSGISGGMAGIALLYIWAARCL